MQIWQEGSTSNNSKLLSYKQKVKVLQNCKKLKR